MPIKFDNAPILPTETFKIALPVGTFKCTYFDPRSVEYQKIVNRLAKPVKKLVEHDALPPEKDRELAVQAFVEACVHGWEGVTAGGEEVPYSVENAVDLLIQSKQTFYDLLDECKEIANFRPSKGDLKNSPTASTMN